MADREPEIKLGQFDERVQRYVGQDFFETVDDVLAAAFNALDREQARWNEHVRAMVQEALDDPRPPIPIDEAFARIHATIQDRRSA